MEILSFVYKILGLQTFLDNNLGILKSTLTTVVKYHREIEKSALECSQFSKKHKSIMMSILNDLEKVLLAQRFF